MFHTIIIVGLILVTSLSFASSDKTLQYIDCSDITTRSWNKAIITLRERAKGTLYLSYNSPNPQEDRPILELKVDPEISSQQTEVYVALKDSTKYYVRIPKEIMNQVADDFEVSIGRQVRPSQFISYRSYNCFSRLYEFPVRER